MTKTPSFNSLGGVIVFAVGVVAVVYLMSQTEAGRRIMGVDEGVLMEEDEE